MKDDTTVNSLFVHAGQPHTGASRPYVRATWVEHWASLHPAQGTADGHQDLVVYATGELDLSDDGMLLTGTLYERRNVTSISPTTPGGPGPGPDLTEFDDPHNPRSIYVSVTSAGAASFQKFDNGKPLPHNPVRALNGTYDTGIIIEAPAGKGYVISVSFTFDWRGGIDG